VLLAQEFDAESDGQTFISAHRRRLIAPDTRSRVYGYLATAPAAAPGYRTDGAWVWPETLSDQVLSRGAAPQDQLLRHMREQYFLLPEALHPGAIEQAAEAARGPATPDPPPPAGTFIGRFTDGDTAPISLLHLIRRDDGSAMEYCYFQDGWGLSDFLKRKREQPQTMADELLEISERAAAELIDRLTDAAHHDRRERARESDDTSAPLRLARVFDGENPSGSPWFSPGRLRIPEPVRRERLAAYLSGGRLVVRATGRMVDPLDPSRGPVVPLSYRTDGTWVWQEALAYYVRSRGVAPEMALLCHIEERGYAPVTDVPNDLVRAAVAEVRAGPAPPPLRPPTRYYRDSLGTVARAADSRFLDAEVLARDLRWHWTDALYKQHYQGSEDDFAQISEEAAVEAIDARWAAGGAMPPLN
jgi:hypothetical protein